MLAPVDDPGDRPLAPDPREAAAAHGQHHPSLPLGPVAIGQRVGQAGALDHPLGSPHQRLASLPHLGAGAGQRRAGRVGHPRLPLGPVQGDRSLQARGQLPLRQQAGQRLEQHRVAGSGLVAGHHPHARIGRLQERREPGEGVGQLPHRVELRRIEGAAPGRLRQHLAQRLHARELGPHRQRAVPALGRVQAVELGQPAAHHLGLVAAGPHLRPRPPDLDEPLARQGAREPRLQVLAKPRPLEVLQTRDHRDAPGCTANPAPPGAQGSFDDADRLT